MNKEIHFFDLDRTLWSIKNNVWLIDKNNPGEPLIELSTEEATYILSGIYKNDENMLEYNGDRYWISDDMLEKIKKKRKSLELENLGISFIEKTNPEYYDKFKFYLENIRHLSGKDNVDVGILSARYSVDNDEKLLQVLKEKLEDIGLNINKLYYTSDVYHYKNTSEANIDKMNVLLEHLVGYHINKDHFVPIKQNFYPIIHFYDDEPQNINVANDIQMFLEEYLKRSDDEVFERISKKINEYKPRLYTHLVTNNQLNRFKTNEIVLNKPIKFSIKLDEGKSLKRFKDFK